MELNQRNNGHFWKSIYYLNQKYSLSSSDYNITMAIRNKKRRGRFQSRCKPIDKKYLLIRQSLKMYYLYVI